MVAVATTVNTAAAAMTVMRNVNVPYPVSAALCASDEVLRNHEAADEKDDEQRRQQAQIAFDEVANRRAEPVQQAGDEEEPGSPRQHACDDEHAEIERRHAACDGD